MNATQKMIANNDRMFRDIFGFDVGLYDPAKRVAGARGLVVQDSPGHNELCITTGICTCGRLPTEEEVEAAR